MLSKNTPEPDSNGDEVYLFIVSTLAPRLPVILGPNITGEILAFTYCKGAFSLIKYYDSAERTTNQHGMHYLKFDASKSSNIYNKNTTVQPTSLVLNYVIKY